MKGIAGLVVRALLATTGYGAGHGATGPCGYAGAAAGPGVRGRDVRMGAAGLDPRPLATQAAHTSLLLASLPDREPPFGSEHRAGEGDSWWVDIPA